MFIPNEIKNRSTNLQILTTRNDNVGKQYQLLVSNLLLKHWDGQALMKVISKNGTVLSQGPFDFILHPLGTLIDREGGPTDMIEFGFDLDKRFEPGLQYFVVFETWKKGNVNEFFSRTFTNFLVNEMREDPPTYNSAISK